MPTPDDRERKLALPLSDGAPLRAVLDTDTFNEIDDQFALAHVLRSTDRITLEAVYAAPFVNLRAASPEEGMLKSLDEIHRVLELVGSKPTEGVYAGSRSYLQAKDRPVVSPAAEDLVRRAHAGPGPLYVLAIAAPTNVASALILDPTIASKIVIVWLGGHALHWGDAREFNFQQDLIASRAMLEGPAPLVLVPCMGVAQLLSTSIPELEHFLDGHAGVSRYLLDCMRVFHDRPATDIPWHKVLWDVAATAWLVNPAWAPSRLMPAPDFGPDLGWIEGKPDRPQIRYVWDIKRDEILQDLFTKLIRK